ncbi:MAG TPA: hypothetical protein DCL77_14365 [Prolixibacteraceae bacterium]|jgi:hypothetical protein|nr:hypothetical protein [Prolixibacteraceae bacterium]
MVTIYFPYWEAGSKWQELRYSLRSLEKHFKEDFKVCIVGDCPRWIQGVEYISYQRDPGKSALWNTNRMMEIFMDRGQGAWKVENKEVKDLKELKELNEDSDLFVRMNDDMYLLRDITLEDLMVTRIIRENGEVRKITSGGSQWRKMIFSTIDELEQREYMGYLTESHCPELFSARKMKLIYQVFQLPKEELLPSTLYYNVFPYSILILDKKEQRRLFYGEQNDYSYLSEGVVHKCEGGYYLNHNDIGLNGELKEFIESRFSEKSRFESESEL